MSQPAGVLVNGSAKRAAFCGASQARDERSVDFLTQLLCFLDTHRHTAGRTRTRACRMILRGIAIRPHLPATENLKLEASVMNQPVLVAWP